MGAVEFRKSGGREVIIKKWGRWKFKFENRMRSGGTYVWPDIYPRYIHNIEFNASNDLGTNERRLFANWGALLGITHMGYSIISVTFAKRETPKKIIHQISMHVFFILAKLFHHSYDCACDIEANMACIEIFVHSVTTKMSHVCICLESISYK